MKKIFKTLKMSGQLEVDKNRGVLYFHTRKGITALRVCGLKIPPDFGKKFSDSIDITLKDLESHPVMYNVTAPTEQ